ncbi:ABC transporter ATP-binding protein [Alloalcanivorax xenomutans]|uniref:ABC transporter ATP-binding protein n=1 Tax=Alloalcanivorax xenomutans TaxID=1094342 RepID=UPI0003B8C5E3|nr:ABC transporter ATP-binding protein [Alloalcanivorax xenomutans]ERS14631.1 ABC transporter ATP-binding protein [Alcanivorax sp. PN-3]MBA4720795.1 ABC transporter ATP-binding protein [Alcanivorax sp.]PHS60345.1 MAG: ABC transporter ATP-binding protein [Alcanivorax sp.]WOD30215.1 ABC transporter ATP-binding protein [Alloalcanivorax xenomutans]CUR48653.1 Branched-chain amino acid transport ATP-binding protein LivF (TC 3.A.1.4.1) [Alloalcanivorax xenomutans]
MSEPILSLREVYADIDQYHILHGVDLDVPAGELTVLLGRNGAGKSTTLRTIMGLTTLTKGQVRFQGRDIGGTATPAIARGGIAFVPENMGIFGQLTVRENMVLAAVSGAMDEQRLNWIFEVFPPLKKFWNRAAGNLSGGQKQMLAIARAVIEPRELLLVDEPTKGLAPAIINDLADAFEQLKQQRVSILLVEQNFNFSRRLGQSVAVMSDGHIVHRGTMAELAEDEDLQHELLGLGLGAHQ